MKIIIYCLLFIIFTSINSYAAISFPKTTFEGHVFIRKNINCKNVSCGTPAVDAKLEFSIDDNILNDSGMVYTDSSGYYKLTLNGCGKYEVKGTYKNIESNNYGRTVSGRCRMLGEKVTPLSWAIEESELDTYDSNNSASYNKIEVIFNQLEATYSNFIYPHENTTSSDGYYYRRYRFSPVSDISINMETGSIWYYWNKEWIFLVH